MSRGFSMARTALGELLRPWSQSAQAAEAAGAAFAGGGHLAAALAANGDCCAAACPSLSVPRRGLAFSTSAGPSSAARQADGAGSSSDDEGGRNSGSSGSGSDSGTSASASSTTSSSRPPVPLPGSKRFYKTARVEPVAHGLGWQVMLDKHAVRTPARNPLVAPTYPLALALAAEWEWLPSGKPILHAMPLMSLAATAIDQPKPRASVVADLLKYAHTDAACVRYEPGPLAERQATTFDPLLAWARKEMGWSLSASDVICGPTQDEAAIAAVRQWLEGLDGWHLAAAEQLTAACKSVVLAAAVLRGRLPVTAAVTAARLEEAFQIEDWGMVEAGHDLDMADLGTRVAAPALLVRLLAARRGAGLAPGASAAVS